MQYLGLCCGAAPHHVRAMAEALGRRPAASRYSEDMSRHVYFGSEPTLARHNLEYGRTRHPVAPEMMSGNGRPN